MALPPGPRLPGILALLTWMRDPIATFARQSRQYGDLYSINNPLYGREVIVGHPDLIRTIFTSDPEVVLGGAANWPLRPIVGDASILLLDRKPHQRERKLLVPPFHGERMGAYADTIRTITERVGAGWPRDRRFALLPTMQRITFDVILETVFGVHADAGIDALRVGLTDLVEKVQSPLGMLWMMPALQRDLGPLTGWGAMKRLLEENDRRIRAIIARARAAPAAERGNDILAMLLSATDEAGRPMSDDELRDELVTLLLAGHETTATALAWVFEEILRRPEIHAKVREEIASVDASALHRAPLPYLDAVIKETLRLRPLVPFLARKLTAPITLREFEIPAGVYVLPCVYLAQRHPDFWEAPDEMRPERFLGKKPDPYAWFPFGGGARRCIGMAFALLEMRIVLATLLARFDLRLTDPRAKVALRSFLFAPSAGTPVTIANAVAS